MATAHPATVPAPDHAATGYPAPAHPAGIRPIRSRPARSHPVHGILAAYPLVCFTGALVTDLAYANTAQMQWANFSVWLIAAGVLMGLLAAVAGIVDALANRRRGPADPRRVHPGRPWFHSLATLLMLALAIVNGFVHSRDAWTSVVPTGLVLSALVAALALVTSWLGYSLETRVLESRQEFR